MKLIGPLLALVAACGVGRDPGLPPDGGGDGGGAPDGPTGGLGHPFGAHTGYHATGVIFPSVGTQAERDQATAAFYAAWKAAYLEPACAPGHFRVHTAPATAAYTVSEAHGYGMLITAIMAGHDPEARTLFDGLYAYFAAHPSRNNPGLMAWAQDQACQDVDGSDSATDGDLDIAYALLLAARQWGTTGPIDYQAEAERVIAAILALEIHPQSSILIGDWANDPAATHYTGTRPSDFMVGHIRAFRAATEEARWGAVLDKTYAIVSYLQAQHAATTGLLPDFVVDAPSATPSPAPARWLEGADDGAYAWNACRTPWRLATDFLVAGEPRAQAAARRMNAFFRAATGDDPKAIVDGYRLDGTPFGSYAAAAFVAPLAVSAMVEPATGTNAPWLDALWTEIAGRGIDEYYGDSINLLALIVVSGNWWAP